jgi:hypothetical protein
LRDRLKLCDWGYLDMLKTLSEKFFGKSGNEAVLMQMFILVQSGYKVRIARTGERLTLLVPFVQTAIVYEYSYIPIDGVKYYVTDKSLKGSTFHVLDREFPGERLASLQISQPRLNVDAVPAKTFTSAGYPDLRVTVSTNRNLIDFYNNYPVSSEWDVYVRASVGELLKRDLYPALRQKISGKNEQDAVNILLNFVQTAFEYQTDPQQFGYERPLFADETFYYPYSDCEDRSILFAVLVKDLLHLDVVLLNYPGHLATAVRFNETVKGDYINIDNNVYIICDPTYINAKTGNAMPQYKTAEATVIRI